MAPGPSRRQPAWPVLHSLAMSLLSRIGNLFKSNLNAAIDSMSDPAKEIDLLVAEM